HAALAALIDVVLGLVERVADELDGRRLGKILDGEDALEDALQPHVLPLLDGDILLQKLLVALLLDVDEVRDVDDLPDLREALSRPEIVLNLRHHSCSPTARQRRTADGRRSSPLSRRKRPEGGPSTVDWPVDCGLSNVDLP